MGMHVLHALMHAHAQIIINIYTSIDIFTDSLSLKFQRDPMICCRDIQLLVHTVTL